MSLVLVQNDGIYIPVKRKGRFAMELEAAKSQAHRQAAARKAWDYFVNTMRLKGFDPLSDRPDELRGPLPHLDVAEDMTSDPGPLHNATRSSLSPEQAANWERAERARMAKDRTEQPEL